MRQALGPLCRGGGGCKIIAVSAIIQLIASVVAIIGTAFAVIAYVYRRWARRVVARRLTNPDKEKDLEDLEDAFLLYAKLLPDQQVRNSSNDIIRWLREMREEERAGIRPKWRDYVIVAKTRDRVCAFLHADYHIDSGLLLVGWLASIKRPATQEIGRFLARELRRRSLRKCTGIVFELEWPDAEKEPWLSRFRLFQSLARPSGITLTRLDFPYIQPRLSLADDNYAEQPQILFYGRANAAPITTSVSKKEVTKVIEVVYESWYGSSFEDEPERDDEYRKYLGRLLDRVTAPLPNQIRAYNEQEDRALTRQLEPGSGRDAPLVAPRARNRRRPPLTPPV